MDTRRTLTKTVGLICVAFLLVPGCVHPRKSGPDAAVPVHLSPSAQPAEKSSIWPVSFSEITSLAKPAEKGPTATEIVCMWQNRVSFLPDPSKNGAMSPGLAGQMFLFGAGANNANANGKLTVDLYDESPAQAGTGPKLIERWEFDKETLKKLASVDETFGRSYTLFLPWPSYKTNISQVRVMLKYEPVSGHTLFAPAAPLTLDASANGQPVWSGGTTNGPLPSSPSPLPGGMPSVPVTNPTSAVGFGGMPPLAIISGGK